MEKRFETFTALIGNISRCIQRIKDEEMAALGLKGKQVLCLFALYRKEGGLSKKQLGMLCGEDKGAISRTVKELESLGLVGLDVSGGKKYRNPVFLTERGCAAAGFVAEKIEDMLERGSCGLSAEEKESLYRSLRLISANLNEICKFYGENNG